MSWLKRRVKRLLRALLIRDAQNSSQKPNHSSQEQGTSPEQPADSEPTPDPSKPSPEPEKTYRENRVFDTPAVDIHIYQSVKLTDRNGRIPEQVVARALANALEDAGFSYVIDWGFPTVEPPDENPRGRAPYWWQPEREPLRDHDGRAANDCNLLLTDHFSGGGTFGHWCVAGAQYIQEDRGWRRVADDGQGMNVHNALHEFGWSVGVPVDNSEEKPGRQHGGMGWNERGKWHRTPMVQENDVVNACDEQVEAREHADAVHHLTYHDCAVSFFDPVGRDDSPNR